MSNDERPKVPRLHVNLNQQTADALNELSARQQITVTEVVRRAVSVYKFVADEVVDGDKVLKLVDPEGNETVLMPMP